MQFIQRTGLVSFIVFFVMIMMGLGTAYAIDLVQLQTLIQEKNVRWSAGRTTVSELPDKLKRQRLGAILSDNRKENDPVWASKLEETLPAYFDWRDSGMVTQVKDQKNCGSCWAFSAVGALESVAMLSSDIFFPDYSEQFVVSYNMSNEGCNGGYMDRVARFLKNAGTISEICMPYRANDRIFPLPCREWRDDRVEIVTSWSWVNPSVEELKAAIYENPISAAYNVYEDFYYYTEGIYEHVFGDLLGGHAIVIVGWDDLEQCFIVKNSWGPEWGENGYFRIAYSQVLNEVKFGISAIDYDVQLSQY